MITTSVTNPTTEVISYHSFANVVLDNASGQKSLYATVSFSPADIVCRFSAGTVQSFASYLTVQTATDNHITLLPEFLQYTNHSCEPNVFFNTGSMELVCLQPIKPGDEFSFFYPSTEWEMAQPFVCNCGHAACIQLINGASHLSVNTLSKYKLTDFIRQQVRLKLAL
ncbi:MAG: SET domain-containing protein-lysine N-methyltransferase [Chitinophagaceae bacterium]|nr:SET domain-containing protein-lysine N-methyltransferase [Chitinophagaceae bacterium]